MMPGFDVHSYSQASFPVSVYRSQVSSKVYYIRHNRNLSVSFPNSIPTSSYWSIPKSVQAQSLEGLHVVAAEDLKALIVQTTPQYAVDQELS